jgi:DNA replicative helicase MCM subunit Mcm2 (Cdc46/Mcm family)
LDLSSDFLVFFLTSAFKCNLCRYGEAIVKDIFVRITELPLMDPIRDIRQAHLNCLIKIEGVVTRRTGVFPQLQEVMYDCGKCGFIVGPIYQQKGGEETRPGSCPECQSKGPWWGCVQLESSRDPELESACLVSTLEPRNICLTCQACV